MYVAFDKSENRIYADSDEKYTECYCPVCGEKVVHKKGEINRPYFSHKQNTNCFWSSDKDYKSEWHIRMQEYFPKENREVRFVDSDSGEIHIADVFIPENNIVIEFQHSPISSEEFCSRTEFHIKNGRRIVWIFDESKENCAEGEIGRFRINECGSSIWPYQNCDYQWMRIPRKFLKDGPDISHNLSNYCVCVYTNTGDEDCVRKIVRQYDSFKYVTLSFYSIRMSNDMNVEEFFYGEDFWLSKEPWKTEKEERARKEQEKIAYERAQREKTANEIFNQLIRNPARSSYTRNWRRGGRRKY